MKEWLERDPNNVVAVHCNSGKGRTGTAICAFFLYCGFLDNVDDCLRFYGQRRFTCGKGVSQPCQLRYLYYFEALYKKMYRLPAVKKLKGITLVEVPNVSSDGCTPYFEIYQCNGLDIKKMFTFPAKKTYNRNHDEEIKFELTEK